MVCEEEVIATIDTADVLEGGYEISELLSTTRAVYVDATTNLSSTGPVTAELPPRDPQDEVHFKIQLADELSELGGVDANTGAACSHEYEADVSVSLLIDTTGAPIVDVYEGVLRLRETEDGDRFWSIFATSPSSNIPVTVTDPDAGELSGLLHLGISGGEDPAMGSISVELVNPGSEPETETVLLLTDSGRSPPRDFGDYCDDDAACNGWLSCLADVRLLEDPTPEEVAEADATTCTYGCSADVDCPITHYACGEFDPDRPMHFECVHGVCSTDPHC